MQTYKETILRFRVVRRDIGLMTDPRRRAEYILNGLDPDNRWDLVWSFDEEADAIKQMEEDQSYSTIYEYKVVDAGKTEVIERSAWF